jgi:hypothetical protein
MDALLQPGVQEIIFKKAFDYVKSKHQKVNLQTCLFEMYNEDLEEEYVVCLCLACISLLEMGSEDFENIQEGLTKKMKSSIMKKVTEHLEKTSSIQ